MLEYDNSAFYYFAITLLVIYIIPGTYHLCSELLLSVFSGGENGSKARTKSEKNKALKIKSESTGFARLKKPSFIINAICLLFAWTIFIYLVTLVINDGEVNTFDPYQILGLDTSAEATDVKKAYRKLSLRYHPDKNIGDKVAEEMFMKIAKAYEALTDNAARENYVKYGNPDGKQSLEVSIGLPRIILDNPKVVLVLYLIAMVIVIPSVVGHWYANSKQYGEKNIMYDTYTAFYQLLQESHRVKNMPEVMAASVEFRAINAPKPNDNEAIGALLAKMKSEKLMVKPKYEHALILRGNLLLHAHLLRMTDDLTPELIRDLNAMLIKSPDLIEGMIEICHNRKWIETSLSAIKFSQCITQGLWTNNHSLEQLPYFTDAEIKIVTKSGSKPHVKSLQDYLRIPHADKKGLAQLSTEEQEEVLKVCDILPLVKVDYKLFVEEEDKEGLGVEDSNVEVENEVSNQPKGDSIYENDLVTLRIVLVRENVTENKFAQPVYAPRYPKTICEAWWIVLSDKAHDSKTEVNIYAFEKITDQGRVVTHEVRFMAPNRVGTYEMNLQILSDCYMGLDQSINISYDVLSAADLPQYQPHPEDLELDNEPTLFEQVMAANVDDSSDDEDEGDQSEAKKSNSKKIEALIEEDDE
eukprot:gene11705-15670_t